MFTSTERIVVVISSTIFLSAIRCVWLQSELNFDSRTSNGSRKMASVSFHSVEDSMADSYRASESAVAVPLLYSVQPKSLTNRRSAGRVKRRGYFTTTDPVTVHFCSVKVIVDYRLWRQAVIEKVEDMLLEVRIPYMLRRADAAIHTTIWNQGPGGTYNAYALNYSTIEVHEDKFPGDDDDPEDYMTASKFYSMMRAYDWQDACIGVLMTYRKLQFIPHQIEWYHPSMVNLTGIVIDAKQEEGYCSKDPKKELPYDVYRSWDVPFARYTSNVFPFSLLRPGLSLADHFLSINAAFVHQIGKMFGFRHNALNTPFNRRLSTDWPTPFGTESINYVPDGTSLLTAAMNLNSLKKEFLRCLKPCVDCMTTWNNVPIKGRPTTAATLQPTTPGKKKKGPRPPCYADYRSARSCSLHRGPKTAFWWVVAATVASIEILSAVLH